MRNYLLLVAAALLFAACSSPRYAYHFDHYDYNSGRKASAQLQVAAEAQPVSPLLLDESTLVASTETTPITLAEPTATTPTTTAAEQGAANLSKRYKAMTKDEKREFRKEVKSQVKAYVNAVKAGDKGAAEKAVQVMDNDLKLAIIFGAVGLTLTLFGTVNEAFWILGVISIVIGVVFLIKWLVRQ
jgi:uncharacterized lipoprotein YmbA